MPSHCRELSPQHSGHQLPNLFASNDRGLPNRLTLMVITSSVSTSSNPPKSQFQACLPPPMFLAHSLDDLSPATCLLWLYLYLQPIDPTTFIASLVPGPVDTLVSLSCLNHMIDYCNNFLWCPLIPFPISRTPKFISFHYVYLPKLQPRLNLSLHLLRSRTCTRKAEE